jgi:hypothetical protein
VHDFLADVNRPSVKLESDLYHVDSPHHTGAKSTRLEQKNLLFRAEIRCEGLKRHKNGWV